MNKRAILCLLLAAAMLFSLSACGEVNPQPAETPAPAEADSQTTDGEVTPATPEPKPEPKPEPSAEPAPEATPAPSAEPVDPRIEALFRALPQLEQDTAREWRYAVTDLDHNGQLELLAASQHQAARETTVKIWELSEGMDALYECSVDLEEGETFPEVLAENADTFHDPATDTWSYLFFDNILLSDSEAYIAKCAVTFRDRTLSYESFNFQHVTND